MLHALVEAARTDPTATLLEQWMIGGGLTLILGAIFYVGRLVGRVIATLQALHDRVKALEDDAYAAQYGMAPRPPSRTRRRTDIWGEGDEA
jgi:hypothetical protein